MGLAPFAAALLRASLAGGLLVAALWLACRLTPALPARVRASLWWLVCLKLLVGCAWLAPVELPLLPAPEAGRVTRTANPPAAAPHAGPAALDQLAGGPPETPRAERPVDPAPVPWVPLLVLTWAAGLAAGAALTGVQIVRLRRTVARARPLDAEPVAPLFADLARRVGLAGVPALRVTPEISSPQAIGLRRPMVLLPPAALSATRQELTMVLCHELVHLRRRDPWLAWVPLLAQRILFFHPLAALAQREFVLAREAACDAEVLRLLGTAPRAYGRLLLRWGVAPRETGLAAAGASPTAHDLKRRLQMLDQTSHTTRRSSPWWWLATIALVLGLVPVTIVAQAPPAPPAPVAPPAPAAAPAPAVAPAPAARAVQASAPAAPAAPAPPPRSGSGSAWVLSSDGTDYALLLEGSHVILHGDADDTEHVRSLRTGDEPLLWFRRDGAEYVVRDRDAIEHARKILSPQMELGQRQGELGGRQGELGGKQGTLGAKQGRLGAEQAELATQQASLAVAAIGADEGTRAHHEGRQRELKERMRALSEKQRELGERQRALGEQQRELGEQQRALGEKQREAAERARQEMKKLLDRALADGLAERVD